MREKVNIAENIAEQIKEYLFSGEISKGEKLPGEILLSQKLGVGRSSLREALRLLTASGYIETIPNRGAFAVITDRNELPLVQCDARRWFNVNRDSLDEMFDVRLCIEPCAARLAASSISDEALRKLSVNLQDFEKALSKVNTAKLTQLEFDFHGTILKESGNRFLSKMYGGLLQMFVQYSAKSNAIEVLKANTFNEHCYIYNALSSRSPSEAEAAMRLHIEISRSHIRNYLNTDSK